MDVVATTRAYNQPINQRPRVKRFQGKQERGVEEKGTAYLFTLDVQMMIYMLGLTSSNVDKFKVHRTRPMSFVGYYDVFVRERGFRRGELLLLVMCYLALVCNVLHGLRD